uniref:Putative secreted protein n=1 Tax=Ixodes ricinus TaxID=34613 RepID=A0A6B0U6U6_IXORI
MASLSTASFLMASSSAGLPSVTLFTVSSLDLRASMISCFMCCAVLLNEHMSFSTDGSLTTGYVAAASAASTSPLGRLESPLGSASSETSGSLTVEESSSVG